MGESTFVIARLSYEDAPSNRTLARKGMLNNRALARKGMLNNRTLARKNALYMQTNVSRETFLSYS